MLSIYSGIPTKGNSNITVTIDDNVVYRFSTEENRVIFSENPEKYKPRFGGFCANAVSDNNLFYINPQTFSIQNEHLLLFYSNDAMSSMDKWKAGGAAEKLARADTIWVSAESELYHVYYPLDSFPIP